VGNTIFLVSNNRSQKDSAKGLGASSSDERRTFNAMGGVEGGKDVFTIVSTRRDTLKKRKGEGSITSEKRAREWPLRRSKIQAEEDI